MLMHKILSMHSRKLVKIIIMEQNLMRVNDGKIEQKNMVARMNISSESSIKLRKKILRDIPISKELCDSWCKNF